MQALWVLMLSENHYQTLASKHLEVLPVMWASLSSVCLMRFLISALVLKSIGFVMSRHWLTTVLGYERLFGPNVAGTAEIVRLALTSKSNPSILFPLKGG